jgi:hypothetical protein
VSRKLYDQHVVTVPEAHAKRTAKAIRKKFGVHVIEGGAIFGGESPVTPLFTDGVNEHLLTVIKIWAEGFAEGANG